MWRLRCRAHRTAARGIESISGDVHQEDSYYRTAPSTDAKIGMLVIHNMIFHGMARTRAHAKDKRSTNRWVQMNGLRKIPTRERYDPSASKLEC